MKNGPSKNLGRKKGNMITKYKGENFGQDSFTQSNIWVNLDKHFQHLVRFRLSFFNLNQGLDNLIVTQT